MGREDVVPEARRRSALSDRPARQRPPFRLAALAADLRSGAVDLAVLLDRIEQRFEAREGEVRAFVPEDGRFERLRREARALTARHPLPASRPALYGVPVGVKDVFHADGFPTRAGSRVPAAELAGPEADSVAALKAAGALVLGKTVSTQFAYFAPGPTRNPHRPSHTPGGSSSGSAAAVGAGLAALALGTQTYGSVTRPAAFCGVVGFKPSYDRISRAGVIPLSPSLDHVGTFTADAAGARLAAAVLCRGFQPSESARPPVLGVPEGPYLERASSLGLAHFRAACERLAEAGYTVKAVAALADVAEVEARHHRIVCAEAAEVHRHWFARHRELYHSKLVDLIESGAAVSAGQLAADLAGRRRLRAELTALMDEHGLDLWLSPAAPGPAPAGLESTGDPAMNVPWTHSGLPTLGLPSGRDPAGLPLGLQLAARWQRDEDLLAWGEALEGALG